MNTKSILVYFFTPSNMDNKKKQFLKLVNDTLFNENDFDEFFTDILTPKEYEDVIDRLSICRELLEGKTVQKVADNLNVATATVVRGNRVVKYGTTRIQKMIEEGVL